MNFVNLLKMSLRKVGGRHGVRHRQATMIRHGLLGGLRLQATQARQTRTTDSEAAERLAQPFLAEANRTWSEVQRATAALRRDPGFWSSTCRGWPQSLGNSKGACFIRLALITDICLETVQISVRRWAMARASAASYKG